MKKFLSYLMFLSIAIGGLFAFSGCSKDMQTYHEISSVDDLYAMKSNKCYQLTCDIDLQEREWYPLEVKGFNGNGYTISNCYINDIYKQQHGIAVNDYSVYMGFFGSIYWLEDTVFDNVNINYTVENDELRYMGIACGLAQSVTDVVIKNSSALFTVAESYANVGIVAGKCGIAKNCKLENCGLDCNIKSDSFSHIGGLVGYVSSSDACFENIKVVNTQINCRGKSELNCGGILGYYDCNNCSLKNCLITGSKIYLESSSSATWRAGGIIGYCKSEAGIHNCASINNSINVNAKYGYNFGGIVGKASGKVTNCLSDSNVLEGITSSTESKQYAGIGGLCGSNSATISKSISQNNRIIGTNSTKSDSMFAAGFVASAEASVVNCAVYNNTVNGGNKDIFTSKNEDLLFNSYIADIGQTSPNVNNLPNVSNSKWNDIINTLSLDEELWTFKSGYLNLKIAE